MASSTNVTFTTEDDGVVSEASALFGSPSSPHSRMAGGTEKNWCRAVVGGTGITLLALLFREPVEASMLQEVVDEVQQAHPRLRSGLVWAQNGPAFVVSGVPCIKVEVMDGQELLAELDVIGDIGAWNSRQSGEVCGANVVDVCYSLNFQQLSKGCLVDVGNVGENSNFHQSGNGSNVDASDDSYPHPSGKGCKIDLSNLNSHQSSNISYNSCAKAAVMDGEEDLSVQLKVARNNGSCNSCQTAEGCKANDGGCNSRQSGKGCEINFTDNLDSHLSGNSCNLCAETEVTDGEEDLSAELKAVCNGGGSNSCQSSESCKVDVSKVSDLNSHQSSKGCKVDVRDSNSHQSGKGCKVNVGDLDSHQSDKVCKVDVGNVGDLNSHQSGNKMIGSDGDQKSGRYSKDWLAAAASHELNICDWLECTHHSQPVPMLTVRLYQFSPSSDSNTSHSLVIFRLHTAICDRASASTILTQMVHSFHTLKQGHPLPLSTEDDSTNCLIAVEDAIPKEKSNKPFWAHGLDILGYSLGSRRHALLPFKDPNSPRRSEIIRLSLSREYTQELLQMCVKQRISLAAALSAAGLKASTILKHLGNQGEHYAIVTLIDCRSDLDHLLTSSTVGFYHSAILNTHFCSEAMEFWGVAKKCSSAVQGSLRNRKHLTDIGDMNFLMCQAMQFPHLTPSCSLRTSLMVLFEDPIVDDMAHLKKAIGLEDYLGCSSIHGVGPSIAIFHTIQDGCLIASCVYPTPLHSRSQMETFIDTMEDVLISAL